MLYLTDPDELGDLLPGQPSFRADQLREWLYQSPVLTTADMTNLPVELRTEIGPSPWPFEVDAHQSADGGTTQKWLFRAPDGASIESVLMGYPKRTTLCISSQAGCAMACSFCATGQFGFERHLTAGEIVAQVAYARAWLDVNPLGRSPRRVTNVVFMGMGEPLANYTHLRESLRRMIDVMGMSARSITVSTVGVAPGIRKLAAEPWAVNLAISLHAADDELREQLVPLNKRYPIADLIDAAHQYFDAKGRRISIEWTLMDGVNDSREQAAKLADIANELAAHVNVIPLNATPLTKERPSTQSHIEGFLSELKRFGVNVTLRDTKGSDIDAACGQLRVRQASAP